MAVTRAYPYNQFNFQVKFGSTQAAFQEVSGLGMEVHVAEYRNGDTQENAPIKVTGLYKVNDVTFKRGVIGDLNTLYKWILNVRSGNPNSNSPTGGITVTINLMDDPNQAPVQTWLLYNARATKLTGPTFNGKGTDVAIEELVVMAEGIEQK
jgi:phage tail-like protein